MTMKQDRIDDPIPPLLLLLVVGVLLPSVDVMTPQTIVNKLVTSTVFNLSRPQLTANTALVIGSDALTVSTNPADAASNATLVQ